MIRRPGFTSFSSATVSGTPLTFYSFHLFNPNLANPIDTIADTSTGVYNLTPTAANLIFSKTAGAGQSYFQSVGNTLYWGDGVEQKKWVQSSISWTSGTNLSTGQFIVDPNGKIQQVTSVQLGGTGSGFTSESVTVNNNIGYIAWAGVFTAPELAALPGSTVSFSGFVTATFLNSTSATITSATNNAGGIAILAFAVTHAGYGPTADSGLVTATSGSGQTGGGQPSWATGLGATTTDGSLIWTNKGSAVETWGISPPTTAPIAVNTALAGQNLWAASTYYWPSTLIQDSNNNLQLLTTVGTTGSAPPTWSSTPGTTTADNTGGGTAVWTCQGQAAWQTTHAYVIGNYVSVAYSVKTQVGVLIKGTTTILYITTNYTDFFVCQAGGTSGGSQPVWRSGVGTVIQDGTVQWSNAGGKVTRTGSATSSTNISNSVAVTNVTNIVDSGGYGETITIGGLTGAAHPTWVTATGGTTTDNQATWTNTGPVSVPGTAAWYYAYAFKNSVTGHVSSASPVSLPIILAAGSYITVSGLGDPNYASDGVDTIEIYRTDQGGSPAILQFLADIPAPASGGNWTYSDTTADAGLDLEILAAINFANNPPPAGIGKLTYNLGRIWGAVQNLVYFSGGPDTTVGNGNEAWPPANVFAFPDTVNRLVEISGGLLVFTTADTFIIYGTSLATFYDQIFQPGVGLSSWNALDIQGSNIFLYTSDRQFLSVSSAGFTWVGYNIADVLQANYTPTASYVSALIQGTDQAVYILDGEENWYRCNWNQPPEGGPAWSPQATITGGATAMAALETAPGLHQLLIGQSGGTVLYRDVTTNADNGTMFNGYITLGSLVLAQPGQIAEVESITLEILGTILAPSVYVMLDEIDPAQFELLRNYVNDPVTLSPSNSVLSVRYYLSQASDSFMCRHMQSKILLAGKNSPDEIVTHSIFGALSVREQ